MKLVTDSIDAAVKEVSVSKGLAIVFHKGSVAYGGQDITADVLRAISV